MKRILHSSVGFAETSRMYLNNDFSNFGRDSNTIKHPRDKEYRGNIFLYQTREEYDAERTTKSNFDAAIKAAGLENLLKNQNYNLKDSINAPQLNKDNADIENLDARLYKVNLGEFVDGRNTAETRDVDLTDSELRDIRIKPNETENTTRGEYAENEEII